MKIILVMTNYAKNYASTIYQRPSQDCVTKMQMHIVFVFHFSSIVHRLSSIIARLGFECYLNGERGVGNERGEWENEKWEENLN